MDPRARIQRALVVFLGLAFLAIVGRYYFRHGREEALPAVTTNDALVWMPRDAEAPQPTPGSSRPASAPSPRALTPEKARAVMLQRIMTGDQEVFKLSPAAIEAFVAQNRTNAQSLLAAFQVSGDPEYLRSAAERFPEDPLVLFQTVVHDAFPDERRAWLDRLTQAAPDNALVAYLSAGDHLESQRTEQGVEELLRATEQTVFHDYLSERVQGLEDIYLAAGKPVADAKVLALMSLALPYLSQLRELSTEMAELQQRYLQAGDRGSAAAMAQMELGLARQLRSPQGATCLANQRVGMTIEEHLLSRLPPAQAEELLGQPVSQRLAEIEVEGARLVELTQAFGRWLPLAPEADLITYVDRVKLYGEQAALVWWQNKHSGP